MIVAYVSGHGYGHATRVGEVLRAVREQAPDLALAVVTAAPEKLFRDAVPGPFLFRSLECDVGLAQKGPLVIDEEGTARRWREFAAGRAARAAAEARWLRGLGARVVLGDVPPLAFEAAALPDRRREAFDGGLAKELRERHGLSYLFISHDLATVRYLASRVAVMYLGVIVEEAEATKLFDHPAHPYTRALLAAVPEPDPEAKRDPFTLSGEIPSPIDIPGGSRQREVESNDRPPGYEPGELPLLHPAIWSCATDSSRAGRRTKAVHRRHCLRSECW